MRQTDHDFTFTPIFEKMSLRNSGKASDYVLKVTHIFI